MCVLAQLVGGLGHVFAAQLLGDDVEVVDGVAADVGAVDLAMRPLKTSGSCPGWRSSDAGSFTVAYAAMSWG